MQPYPRAQRILRDSVIRRMTGISNQYGRGQLSLGFRDVTARLFLNACPRSQRGISNQYSLTWGAQNFAGASEAKR